MTEDQQKHLNSIVTSFAIRLRRKYAKGQEEHGGNLWDRNCLLELGREITDLNTYFFCVEEHYRKSLDLTKAIVETLDLIPLDAVPPLQVINLTLLKQLVATLQTHLKKYDNTTVRSSQVSSND